MNEQLKILITSYASERSDQILTEAQQENPEYQKVLDSLETLESSLYEAIPLEAETIFEQYIEAHYYENAIITSVAYLQGIVDGICIYNNAKKI